LAYPAGQLWCLKALCKTTNQAIKDYQIRQADLGGNEMTTNYEVFDLLEVGSASVTILDKPCCELDELAEPIGISAEGLDE